MDNDLNTVEEPIGGGRRWVPIAAVLGVLLAVGLIGGGFLIGLHSGDKGGSTAAATASPSVASDKLTQAKAFVACMRKNGVPNHPDPAADGSIQLSQKDNVDVNSAAFKSAQAICKKSDPIAPQQQQGAPPGAADTAAYVKCMREHGIPDFPDPVNGTLNFNADPKVFQPAHAACKKYLPSGAPAPR